MKYTPGPWELRFTEIGELEIGGSTEQSTGVYSNVGFGLIANVIFKKTNILGDSYKLQKDQFKANAQLIATAPELLEASSKLLEAMNQYEFFMDGYKNGRASISEVTFAGEDRAKAKSILFDVIQKAKGL